MDKKVRDLIDKYQYDRGIRKHSDKYFWNDNGRFRKVTSKKDVERALQSVQNTIKHYEKVYPLVSDDIEQLEKSLGEYEIAIKKVLQCYDMNSFDFDYTADELMGLISKINDFAEQISQINFKKMCQD